MKKKEKIYLLDEKFDQYVIHVKNAFDMPLVTQ